MKDYIKAMLGIVIGLAVLTGVVLGGWEAGWWFTNQNANREAHVIRNSYSNQQTLRDQITKGLSDVADMDRQIAHASESDNTGTPSDAQQLTAQRKAIANQVCQEAEQITGDALPADQASWVQNNCVMGSAK